MITLATLLSIAVAQQPNTYFATLTIDNNNTPPYPIACNVRTSTTSQVAVTGLAFQPLAIVKSGNGNVSVHAATYFGNSFDLPVTPAYVLCVDGYTNQNFRLDSTGTFSFPVAIPAQGTAPSGIPLNFHDAFQAVVANPTSAYGQTLTAATRITVTAGPQVTFLQLGDDGSQAIPLTFLNTQVPFYGVNYSVMNVCANGFVTFVGADSDYTPTTGEFTSGYPRISMFWTDLEQGTGIIKTTLENNPGPGASPYARVEFIGVWDYGGTGFNHTFDMTIDASGTIVINYPPSNTQSVFDCVCGVGPGNSLGNQSMKDLSQLLNAGATLGAINENFHEWFGTPGMPYYTPTSPVPTRPFDLFGRAVTFLPTGSGTLPQSTNRYVMY